jgi:hypothetical protein
MILGFLSTLLGSSFLGSITGMLAAWFKGKQELEVRRLELEHESRKMGHEITLRGMDLDLARVEAAGRKDVALIEGDAASEVARLQAIAKVVEADAVTPAEVQSYGRFGKAMMACVSFVQKIIRPGLTIYLVACAVVINSTVLAHLGVAFDAASAPEKLRLIEVAMSWVSLQASACLGYYFLQRRSASSQ